MKAFLVMPQPAQCRVSLGLSGVEPGLSARLAVLKRAARIRKRILNGSAPCDVAIRMEKVHVGT